MRSMLPRCALPVRSNLLIIPTVAPIASASCFCVRPHFSRKILKFPTPDIAETYDKICINDK